MPYHWDICHCLRHYDDLDLWPQKIFLLRRLAWRIFVPSFIKIPSLSAKILRDRRTVNGQRTDHGQTDNRRMSCPRPSSYMLSHMYDQFLATSHLHRVPCGAEAPLSPLSINFLIFCPLLFSFFHWLYLFSSFVHRFPLYQNTPTPFPGRRS